LFFFFFALFPFTLPALDNIALVSAASF